MTPLTLTSVSPRTLSLPTAARPGQTRKPSAWRDLAGRFLMALLRSLSAPAF